MSEFFKFDGKTFQSMQTGKRLDCVETYLTILPFMHVMASSFYELPHDKTNKMTVRPVKPQISLGIRFFMRTAKTQIRLGGCPG